MLCLKGVREMTNKPEVHAAILKPPCSVTVIAGAGAPMHWHNFPQIWFVRRGEILHTVGKETCTVREGSCIFVPSLCPHGTIEATSDTEVVSISFAGALFASLGEDIFLSGEEPYMMGHRIEYFSHFEGEARDEISELISAVKAECARPMGGRASKLFSLFIKIFKKISSDDEVKKISRAKRRKIKEIDGIVDYAAEEISDKMPIDDFCKALNISYASFARNFKEVTGMSFGRVLAGMRVRYSCLQLVRTEKKMVQIAGEAGFYDEAHFAHVFTEHMGETPTQYRLNNKTIFDDVCIYCEDAPREIVLPAKRKPRRKRKFFKNERFIQDQ